MSDNWQTPQDLFDVLDSEFMFDLDAAASDENSKCGQYISERMDALKTPWTLVEPFLTSAVFCNPPYSNIGPFVQRAYEQSEENHTCNVILIPTYTDTRYWRDYVLRAHEIRHLVGRLQFLDETGEVRESARFPSSVVIFKWIKGRKYGYSPHIFNWDWKA